MNLTTDGGGAVQLEIKKNDKKTRADERMHTSSAERCYKQLNRKKNINPSSRPKQIQEVDEKLVPLKS